MTDSEAVKDDYSGIWLCRHWYPSPMDDREEINECHVQAEQTGNHLILQSPPDEHNEYLLIKLRLDGSFAHGSWTENSSELGEFEGQLYNGLLEMIIDEDKQRIAGKWVGIGQDRVNNRPDVYTGRWELIRPTS